MAKKTKQNPAEEKLFTFPKANVSFTFSDLKKADSTNVKATGFFEGNCMVVTFNKPEGVAYLYTGITPEDYQSFLASESLGREIRNIAKKALAIYKMDLI